MRGAWSGGLGLGAVALAAAVASGSRPLGVVGVGFLLAAGLTWLWTWLAEGPVRLKLEAHPAPAIEGDRVRIVAEVRRPSRVPVGSMAVRSTIGQLGTRVWTLRGKGRVSRSEVDLGPLPRGVFALSEPEVIVGDLLGLVTVRPAVSSESRSLIVRPRLAALDGLFSEAGRLGRDGRKLLLRRSAGFDFHSVRDYEQGESLRRVHWPTSARRGQLMVKELEESADDGVLVLLDCDPAGAVGIPPDSSFDAAVRAAGSVLQAHAERGRATALTQTSGGDAAVSVRTGHNDLDAALYALAATSPDAACGLARYLGGRTSLPAGAEVTIVTAAVDPAAFTAVLGLTAHRLVSLVWVDAASFASRPTRAEPGVLRLAAHGVPTAVLRRGDDLAAVLSARSLDATAHG
jgi:uncharacterized protein (DUF58 family)